MVSLTGFNRSFTPKWQMCLLALLSMMLLMTLGFWQIERAHQKQNMLKEEHHRATQGLIRWMPSQSLPKQYQRIEVKGHFLSDIFLLDNQHRAHQFGFDVLSPLLMENGQVILIDRGWVPGDITRQVFPKVDLQPGELQLKGHAYYPSEKNWSLGPIFEKKQAGLVIVELIDIKLISQILHKSIYPFIIRLEPNDDHRFVRQWSTVSMLPDRHYAYALQWFLMAFVVFILFITLNLKKHDEKK